MMELQTTTIIDSVEIHLPKPDELTIKWIGQMDLIRQLRAAWHADEHDLPMNPRLIGKPGVGKTTLAYCTAQSLDRPVYMFQATMDTRPEDLIVTPVIGDQGTIRYIGSSLVAAMINGGTLILDEGNRMSEKSWASLAPMLDNRRYIESVVAGVKIKAHPSFRFCTTMNDDSSTYEIPEYIDSRLQPKIFLDYPEREDELRILRQNLPLSSDQTLRFVVDFLQQAHSNDDSLSVRDGINIAKYADKLAAEYPDMTFEQRIQMAIRMIIDSEKKVYD